MAIEARQRRRKRLDDGSSAIDKRHLAYSRRKRVRSTSEDPARSYPASKSLPPSSSNSVSSPSSSTYSSPASTPASTNLPVNPSSPRVPSRSSSVSTTTSDNSVSSASTPPSKRDYRSRSATAPSDSVRGRRERRYRRSSGKSTDGGDQRSRRRRHLVRGRSSSCSQSMESPTASSRNEARGGSCSTSSSSGSMQGALSERGRHTRAPRRCHDGVARAGRRNERSRATLHHRSSRVRAHHQRENDRGDTNRKQRDYVRHHLERGSHDERRHRHGRSQEVQLQLSDRWGEGERIERKRGKRREGRRRKHMNEGNSGLGTRSRSGRRSARRRDTFSGRDNSHEHSRQLPNERHRRSRTRTKIPETTSHPRKEDGAGDARAGKAPSEGNQLMPSDALTPGELMSWMKGNRIIRAVGLVQRVVRGFWGRQRASRIQAARTALRNACFGVAMEIIETYICKDVAPSLITACLAEGMEGVFEPEQRVDATVTAQLILDEVTDTTSAEAVKLAIREETDRHLDEVFVRDRRNPLLATVDDIASTTLRASMREVVVDVVRESTNDYLFGRRIYGLVEDLIEEEVVSSAASIATSVHHNYNATTAYLELVEEVCSEEAVSVVAETMAPLKDRLVQLQREKDVSAIQAAAHSVIVKGVQLKHAARTVGQRGRLVAMSEISGRTLSLLIAGRFLAILRAAEENRQRVSTSPLLFMLFRRLVVRAGRNVLLAELSRELDRDETALHKVELERIHETDRRRRIDRARHDDSSKSAV